MDRSEEIVQDALKAVLRRIRNCEANGEPFPSYMLEDRYINRVAHNAVDDKIRWILSRGEVPIGDSAPLSPPISNPLRLLTAREIRDAIHQCLGHLVEPRQKAVVLHLLGHNVPEIARLMNWTRRKASNLVYRGLANLRDCLKERGWNP